MTKKIKQLDFAGNWDLAPAPESTSHINIKDKYGLFIDGKFIKPNSGKYFLSINPATEDKLAMIAEANEKMIAEISIAGTKRAEKAHKTIKAIKGYHK